MILFAFLLAPDGRSRVPDGNETVKKQAIGANFVKNVAAGLRQAERAADAARYCFREQEAATPFGVLPFHHLELGVDALGRQPVDRHAFAADSVDQTVGEALAAGEDRTV